MRSLPSVTAYEIFLGAAAAAAPHPHRRPPFTTVTPTSLWTLLSRERSKQLVTSGQRCAELEMTAKQLQEALAQAMRSLRPEALDKLGGAPLDVM